MASTKGVEYYNKKLSDMRLIDWQFLDGGTWKSFDQVDRNTNGDKVLIESAFQAGNKTCELNHGWWKTFKINFESKTSTNTRSNETKTIRRWCKKTLQELHNDEMNEKRDRFLRSNRRKAEQLWNQFLAQKKGGGTRFDFPTFFNDGLKASGTIDINIFVWFWKTDDVPAALTKDSFNLGLAQLSNSTSTRNIQNNLETEKRKLKSKEDYWAEFYKWMFGFAANDKTKKSVPITGTGKRQDPADQCFYTKQDVVDYYGEEAAEEKWASFAKETPKAVKQWHLLLSFIGLNDRRIQPSTPMPGLADAWQEFLTERPEGIFENSYESIGRDEWWAIYQYLSALRPDWAGFDEFAAPSLVSEFKDWAAQKWKGAEVGTTVDDDDW